MIRASMQDKKGTRSSLMILSVIVLVALYTSGCAGLDAPMDPQSYALSYDSVLSPKLQAEVETLDTTLRAKYGMTAEQTSVGVLDLKERRLAMIHADRIEYAASVPKVGILLAYFQLHAEAEPLDRQTAHELGLMVKASSNEIAAKYSRAIGLTNIQRVLDSYGLYDRNRGGGIWVGKHYGKGDERIGDPVGNHSHAATVRQLLRFYLLMEQGKLVSPEASRTMRGIFASPDIPHDNIKFVKGLEGRPVQILRKWGSWQNWLHDTALISGPNRHYILVALTNHPRGDEYLVDLSRGIDDLIVTNARGAIN